MCSNIINIQTDIINIGICIIIIISRDIHLLYGVVTDSFDFVDGQKRLESHFFDGNTEFGQFGFVSFDHICMSTLILRSSSSN